MDEFIHSPLGAIHTLTAMLALAIGAVVLSIKKGTGLHKKLGYFYVGCMIVLNVSAIPITNMTGSFGLFHVFVVVSLPTIIAAIYFPVFARENPNWKLRHFEFMFWSYAGLIAAFIAEVMVRLPAIFAFSELEVKAVSGSYISFFIAFAILGVVMGVSEFLFRRYRRKMFG
jgi:uncharacterized membrane protein